VHAPDQFDGTFDVPFRHRIIFERDALGTGSALAQTVASAEETPTRLLVVLDAGLVQAHRALPSTVEDWCTRQGDAITLVSAPLVVTGSEAAKDGMQPVVEPVIEAIRRGGICRRSAVLAIGGGAMLDAVGLATALAHRGVRLIRMPTTTLAQGDAGIGVKNGVNQRGAVVGGKNLLGTFAVPDGVINDATLLQTLCDEHWRGGLAEAIKVALVKDASLLEAIECKTDALLGRDLDAMESILRKTANLHLRHIVDGGDPFESNLARPLDFGHWAAHELENRSAWRIGHGEAVAIGLCIDLHLGEAMGITTSGCALAIQSQLQQLGFLQQSTCGVKPADLLSGLEHFRQHLGGQLTIAMIQTPGHAVDVHEIDPTAALTAVQRVFDALPAE
jgi:3-dehydroquinate synthase